MLPSKAVDAVGVSLLVLLRAATTCLPLCPRLCWPTELLLRRPWLPGSTDVDQLGKIFAALGTPNEQNWPGGLI
jgi:hypothetical protein